MYFGSFLVEKNIISKKQMLEALAMQMEGMPSLLRIFLEKNLISEDILFSCVEKGFIENKGLFQVLEESGELTGEIINNALEEQNNGGISFGHCLVELGHLDRGTLDDRLRDYLDLKEEKPSSSEQEPAVNNAALESLKEIDPGAAEDMEEPAINNAALESLKEIDPGAAEDMEEPAINNAALESLKEIDSGAAEGMEEPAINNAALESLKEIDSDAAEEIATEDDNEENKTGPVTQENIDFSVNVFQKEFFDVFDEQFKSRLEEDLSVLPNLEGLNSFFNGIKMLLGASRLANFQLLEKLLFSWEKILLHFIETPEHTEKMGEALGLSLKEMTDLAWQIREHILTGQPETSLVNDESWKTKFLNNIKAGMNLMKSA